MISLYVGVSSGLQARQSCTQTNLRQSRDGDEGFDSESSPGPTAWMQGTCWLLTIQESRGKALWALNRVLSNPSSQVKSISFFYVSHDTMCITHWERGIHRHFCVKGSITGDPTEIAQLQSSWLADLGISKPRIISQVFIGSWTHSSILLWYTMGLTLC